MNNYTTELYNSFGMQDYFIIYFDILGYKNIVNQKNKEKDLSLLTTINDCIVLSKNLFSAMKNTPINCDIKMKVFSDNFFYCSVKDYIPLITFIGCLQCALIQFNTFIRGSLSFGSIVYNDDFIFGKGLIDAFENESEIAVFPRIIVDNSFFAGAAKIETKNKNAPISINDIRSVLRHFFNVDFDNNEFIDYLGIMKNYRDNAYTGSETYNFQKLLYEHGKNICNNLMTENKIILQKYHWCCNYHNKFCEKHNYNDLLI